MKFSFRLPAASVNESYGQFRFRVYTVGRFETARLFKTYFRNFNFTEITPPLAIPSKRKILSLVFDTIDTCYLEGNHGKFLSMMFEK